MKISKMLPAGYPRLLKTLQFGPPWQFILAEAGDDMGRDHVIALLDETVGELRPVRCDVGNFPPDDAVTLLKECLDALSQDHRLIHVCNAAHWLTAVHWHHLNLSRERMAKTSRSAQVWWLPSEQINQCADQAPDLWSWRSGTYDLAIPDGSRSVSV